ncbi:MAG: hypothetical protein KAX55_00670 [Propionivibrio sp.]|nr:hypothetical protein [Propionivibrio sp.]
MSEHQVSLNVYNSPDGKRLILRPLASNSLIPPEITQLGFELRGGNYERRDLQFSLPQLRRFFPLASSREFSMSEIFVRPPQPVVDVAAPAAIPKARAPWHVTRAEFVNASICRVAQDGRTRVVFDDIEYLPVLGNDWTPKKAKEEVHARMVRDALAGRSIDPFPASPPPFKVILDYPGQVYAVNQRAEKNISRLLAQLDVTERLLDGDDAYFRIENPPYIDLVVERLPGPDGNRLYFTHYLRVDEGDTILDAEMVFDIRENGALRLAETATQNPVRGGELRGRDVSFANIFSKNLLDQGFGKGKILWPRDEQENELSDASATVFAVGQRVRFARGLYEGSEGSIESIAASGHFVVRGDRGTGFGVTADEAVEWGVQILPPAEELDPTTPEGYAAVRADEALQLKYQDALDAFFAERIVAVRNALRALGWTEDAAPAILKKPFDGVTATAAIDVRQVGAGRNVVGIIPKVYTLQSGEIQSLSDDLTQTPEELANRLEEAALKANLKPSPIVSPEELYANELVDYWAALGKEVDRNLAVRRAREFFEAISTRDEEDLVSRLRPSTSPLSRKWFEKITGVSLGRTFKETKSAIRTWAVAGDAPLPGSPASESPSADTVPPAGIDLPDYLRAVESGRARSAWEKSCAEHDEPIKRIIDGYWQMARALWNSPDGESSFPDAVKTAIHTIGDTLRFGHPASWTFDGALAHLFKVSERLAEELETADIEKDAGFRQGQRHSTATYRADAEKFEALRDKATKGTLGGLIALGDAVIANVDASPMSRFSKAYHEYVTRIEAEIQRLTSLATEKEKSQAEKADAALQAKYGPFDPKSVRMPTAIQLGLDNKIQTQLGEAILRLFPGGWSNGHMLELGRRPKLVNDAIVKYYGDEHSSELRPVDQSAVDRIVNTAKVTSRIKVEPLATYDDEFVVRGGIAGSGVDMKREKDHKIPVNAVILGNEVSALATQVDRRYFAYFASTYKGCEFFAPPDGNGTILVKHEDNVVGVVMSIRFSYEMRDMLKCAMRAQSEANASAAIVAKRLQNKASANETATSEGKVKVYGAPDSPEIDAAYKEVIAIALKEYLTEKGAREYAHEAARGELSEAQRKHGSPDLVAAADRLYDAYQANLRLADSFRKTLDDEIIALANTLPGDPAFQPVPLSDAIKLVARGDHLDVHCTDRGSRHVVSVFPLENGNFQARHGSAESCPTSLLTAVLWASSRIEELRAADRKAREAQTESADGPAIAENRYRTIKVYIDGFRRFVPTGQPIDGASLMKAIEPFVSDSNTSSARLTDNARFLGSGSVGRFDLPNETTVSLLNDDVLRLSASGYTCEILATEPAPAFDDECPWIQKNHERNAPMSFVGALSSAAAWLKENLAWEAKKASYPDGGKRLDELARQYALFLREGMPTHHDGVAREMHRSFATAIMDKNVDYLAGWIARSRGQNELSKKYFTKATGCKLPATIRDITSALYAWAGFTPEQAAAREQAKEAAHEAHMNARRIDDDIEWCGNALSNTRVNHDGQIKSTKQFLDEIIAKGFNEIRKYKAGAVDRYSLANPDEHRSYLIKGKMVTYAKAVLAKAEQQKEQRIELEANSEEAHHTLRP